MGAILGLGDCPLAFGDDGAKLAHLTDGGYYCAWCGAELPPRRRRWCSDACSRAFGANHTWTVAREAAKDRDGHMCRICLRGWGAAHLLVLLLETWGHDVAQRRDLVDDEFAEIFRAWSYGAKLEVNHVTPRRGGGYGLGCWHHQEAVARELLLRCEVSEGGSQPLRVILEGPKSEITRRAENASDAPGGVIVVYVRDDLREAALADGTRVPLRRENRPILVDVEPVVESEVPGSTGALTRAPDGVSACDSLRAAEEARHRFVADPTAVAGLAPGGAVEPSSALTVPDERRAALEAEVRYGAAVERPRAAKPGIVDAADLSGLVAGDVRAPLDSTVHLIVIVGAALPVGRGGLETLCREHHVIETRRQAAHLLARRGPDDPRVEQLRLSA